jgi:hypothetical protein
MAWIPRGAHWYLAQVVEEITVAGERDNILHINWLLIDAASPDDAFEKAIACGKEGEQSYANPDGQLVTIHFCGLRDLIVIYEDLEDGAELYYEERVGVPEDEILRTIRTRNDLSVFRPIEQRARPNYASKEVVDEVSALLARIREEEEGRP